MYSGTQLYKFEKDLKVSPSEWDQVLPRQAGKTKILIINGNWPLTKSQQEMFSKLVDAVNLSADQAWIAHLPSACRTAIHLLKADIPFQYIVGVGLEPERLSIHASCELYQPIDLNGIQVIFTHPLDKVEPNKALRMSLWEALKQMFNLK